MGPLLQSASHDGGPGWGGVRDAGRRPARRGVRQRRRGGLRRAGGRRVPAPGADLRCMGPGCRRGGRAASPCHGVGPGTSSACCCPARSTTWSATRPPSGSGRSPRGSTSASVRARSGSILERTVPAVTVVDDGAGRPRRTGRDRARTVVRDGRARPAARRPAAWPDRGADRSGGRGVDQRHDRDCPRGRCSTTAACRAVAEGTDVLSAPGDRRLSPLPFAHVGSMTRVWDEAANGVTTVITPTPWRAADADRRDGGRAHHRRPRGCPPSGRWCSPAPSSPAADLSSLRVAGTGASRVPAELVAAMRAALGVPVVVRYTSTEASLGTGTVPGDPDEAVATSVGRPVPGVDLSGGRRRRDAGRRPARSAGSGCARRRSCAATGAARRPVPGAEGWSSTTGSPPTRCWRPTAG